MISEETRKWWVLGAVSCLLGLILLDETVVGVALPTIQKDFGLSTTGGHWVVNAYLLSFACLVAIGGKLADMFGILKVFLIGLAIFACSSILASVSPNGGILITARALQGIGAAICFPLFVAMTTITFPKEQRGTALGICGAVGTIFLAAGPFVGGLLTEIGSWRWIFAINPPFVLGIAVVSLLAWRDVPRPPRAAIDWLGLALLASSLFCLVFALMEADDWGWTSPTIVTLLILGLALLGAFIWAEVREDAPLIEVGLFLNKSFAASNLTMFIAQFAKMPIFVFVALYAQEALGLGPLGAGMLVMLSAILQPIVATVCGRMTDRMRPANLIYFGQVTLFVCLVWLCVTAPLKDPYSLCAGPSAGRDCVSLHVRAQPNGDHGDFARAQAWRRGRHLHLVSDDRRHRWPCRFERGVPVRWLSARFRHCGLGSGRGVPLLALLLSRTAAIGSGRSARAGLWTFRPSGNDRRSCCWRSARGPDPSTSRRLTSTTTGLRPNRIRS